MKFRAIATPVAAAIAVIAPAAAQSIDDAVLKRWNGVTAIRYEVTGTVTDKHVQIPPTDADLYADVAEKVTLYFLWDAKKKTFIGEPKFKNHPATTSNLEGLEKGCPTGSINGAYEHFDIVSMKPNGQGAIELIGERRHPETLVAESCGAGTRKYAGAVKPVSQSIAPPEPFMLAYRSLMPKDGPIKFSADGLSIIMTAQNNNWIWTYTPTPAGEGDDLSDLEVER